MKEANQRKNRIKGGAGNQKTILDRGHVQPILHHIAGLAVHQVNFDPAGQGLIAHLHRAFRYNHGIVGASAQRVDNAGTGTRRKRQFGEAIKAAPIKPHQWNALRLGGPHQLGHTDQRPIRVVPQDRRLQLGILHAPRMVEGDQTAPRLSRVQDGAQLVVAQIESDGGGLLGVIHFPRTEKEAWRGDIGVGEKEVGEIGSTIIRLGREGQQLRRVSRAHRLLEIDDRRADLIKRSPLLGCRACAPSLQGGKAAASLRQRLACRCRETIDRLGRHPRRRR